MLQTLRAASKSWVASAIIFLFIGVFALWGVNDIFRGSIDDTVAKVGDRQISVTDYDRELRNTLRAQSAQQGTELTMEDARSQGIDRSVLETMVDRAALDREVGRLGLVVSDATVAKEIRENRAFQGPDGVFDRLMLQQRLSQMNMSEDQLLVTTRSDVARRQMVNAAISGAPIAPGLTRLLHDYLNEQRNLEYVVLTADDAGTVAEPSDAELTAYHKAHAGQFSTPEFRALDYIEIGPADVANEIQIADDDLKKAYDARKDTLNKPETREVEQIVFPSQPEAQQAADKIKTGADFLALAHERKLSDQDIKLGTFAKAQLDPKLAEPAFSVKEGGISAPFQGPFGWVVLHVPKVNPGEEKTFDQAKDQIRADLVKDKSTERVVDMVNSFEDARAGGATIAEAAKRLGLTVHHIDAVDSTGQGPQGKAAVPQDPGFLQAVFMAETGDEGDPFQSKDGATTYAVKIDGITPPALKPLADVRDAVKASWMKEKRGNALKDRVTALTAQAQTAKDLAPVTKATGKQVQTAASQTRRAPNTAFSRAVYVDLFASVPGTVIFGPAAEIGSFMIARVTGVRHPPADPKDPENESYGQILAGQMTDDIGRSLAASLRTQAGVTVNEATRQRTVGETP